MTFFSPQLVLKKRKNISLRGREYFENLLDTFGDNALLYISYINVEKAVKRMSFQKDALEGEIEALGEKSPKKNVLFLNKQLELKS